MDHKTHHNTDHEGDHMKNRMTQQSRANIEAATSARLHDMAGAYTVELIGTHDRRACVNTADGPAMYPTAELATRALRRLNPSLPITHGRTGRHRGLRGSKLAVGLWWEG